MNYRKCMELPELICPARVLAAWAACLDCLPRLACLDLGMPGGRPAYFTKGEARAVVRPGLGDIAQRNDADKPLVAAEHRQAPDLDVAHILGDLVEILVFEAIFHFGGHDVA